MTIEWIGDAKYLAKGLFLQQLTMQRAMAMRRLLGIERGAFWRAAQGKIFLNLPKREVQREFDFSIGNAPEEATTVHERES